MTFIILYLLLLVEHSTLVKFNSEHTLAPSDCRALLISDMEKVELGYSAKCIPVPSNNVYLQIMISKAERFIHNFRWKALFFLKPAAKPKSKQTFGFKSTAPAPGVPELKQFENELADLIENIQFGRKPNPFQQKLKADERKRPEPI